MYICKRGNRYIYKRRWIDGVDKIAGEQFYQVALGTGDLARANRSAQTQNLDGQWLEMFDRMKTTGYSYKSNYEAGPRKDQSANDNASAKNEKVYDVVNEAILTKFYRKSFAHALHAAAKGMETDSIPLRDAVTREAVRATVSTRADFNEARFNRIYDDLMGNDDRLTKLLRMIVPSSREAERHRARAPNAANLAETRAQLSANGIEIDPESPELRRACHYQARANLEVIKLFEDRQEGTFSYKPTDELFEGITMSNVAEMAKTMASEDDEPFPVEPTVDPSIEPVTALTGLADAFLASKSSWSTNYVGDFRNTCAVLFDVFGANSSIANLKKSDGYKFRDILAALPANWQKKAELKALHPVRASVEARRLGMPPRAPGTLKKELNLMQMMFAFAHDDELISRNPFANIQRTVKDHVPDHDKRHPLKSEALQRVMLSPLYTGCQNDGHRYARPGDQRPRGDRFWLPLLLLFQGLRLAEACQIELSDIGTEDGVMFISIQVSDAEQDSSVPAERSQRSLKTQASWRRLPVHPELLRIGFAARVAELRAAGRKRLFCSAIRHTDGKFHTMSKWINRWIASSGVKTSAKICGHSFRHTFKDALDALKLHPKIERALGGWSSRDVADNYGSPPPLADLWIEMQRLTFKGLDLSHLYVD